METSNLVGVPIVKELLTRENYEAWRVWMKNYLLGQDLWDVVENFTEPSSSVRMRKNAATLHAIQMSCGPEALSLVMDALSAQVAWNRLANEYASSRSSSLDSSDFGLQFAPSIYQVVQRGEWTLVKALLQAYSADSSTETISVLRNTALHAAVSFGHLDIVKNLVHVMTEAEMEMKDTDGYTALASAALTGITEIAECIFKRNENLVITPNNSDQIPVTVAVLSGHIKMAHYLYSVTPLETFFPENGHHGAMLLNQSFLSNNLDLSLHLLKRCPSLALTLDEQEATIVWALAGKPSVFLSGCKLHFWQRWIYEKIQIEHDSATKHISINITKSKAIEREPGVLHQLVAHIFKSIGINRIYDSKLTHVLSAELLRLTCKEISNLTNVDQLSRARVYDSLCRAAQCGIPEFIIEVIKANPNLSTVIDKDDRNLFFKAVEFRQAKVFNLIYGYHSKNAAANSGDRCHNTLLHMAAILEPSTQLDRISGAALQMQRELQWFKEVEHIMQPVKREIRNIDGMTARELFTKSHKDLAKAGEKWMKQTATSCTVVAALIVTIMFAASITVPGGNNQNTGYPMFQDHKLFKLFIIADAISLFSSTTSLLMFLGILTSRYAEDDFLKSLPTKLIIGLSMLFVSVAAMMITFSAAISVMLPGRLQIVIPVISFASIPVSLFVWLLFPLLYEIYVSTYRSGIFERNIKRWV